MGTAPVFTWTALTGLPGRGQGAGCPDSVQPGGAGTGKPFPAAHAGLQAALHGRTPASQVHFLNSGSTRGSPLRWPVSSRITTSLAILNPFYRAA